MAFDEQELLLDIYNTVVDQSRWPSVLGRLSEVFDAVGCIVFDADDDGKVRKLQATHFSPGYDPALVEHYMNSFHDQEMAFQDRFARTLAPDNRVETFGADLRIPSERADRDPESVEWLAALGIERFAASFLDKDDSSRTRFSFQMAGECELDDDERMARANRLLPHVAKAFELGRPAAQLARQHRNLVEAMDRLRVGVCILDRRGRVVISNHEFRRQADTHGTFRTGANGRMYMADPASGQRFDLLLAQAAEHGKFGARPRHEAIIATGAGDAGALCVEIAPLETCDELGTSRIDGALVFSLDTSLPMETNQYALRAIFGLTETESQLVRLICEGRTNTEIAERRDRSVQTINAQVKSILSKTNSSNRTQLVRLLSGFEPVVRK